MPALGDHPLPEVDRVLAEPKLAILDARESSAQSALVSPISLRDQVFGVLGLHQLDPDQPWTEDQIELVAAIADQMGLMIENSRLFEEAQSRAGRERQHRTFSAMLRRIWSALGCGGRHGETAVRALANDLSPRRLRLLCPGRAFPRELIWALRYAR